MTRSRSRLLVFVALMLTLALVASAGISTVVLGADEIRVAQKNDKKKNQQDKAEEPTPEPTPSPTPEPTPEPTPYPEFDPSSVTLRLDLLADGFDAPVFIADDGVPGQRCRYVVERGGLVRIIEADEAVRPRSFLNLEKLLEGIGPEQGLHSIAFHPDFRTNGRFFAHYTTANNTSVVAEFKGKACRFAASNQPKRLLSEKQEYINNNGGWIGFGPDGMLYISTGDGGGPAPGDPNANGQAPGTRLGKILRIDVDSGKRYEIPADNPFVKRSKTGKLKPRQGFARETWAYGLRDPRRASFDRESGDLWIGDVGQDRFEEINRIPDGETKKNDGFNFGWSHVVGADTCHKLPDCDPSLYDAPVYYYDKVSPHRGVTGGYVYRGEALPNLNGVYLFSDVASGYIWGLDADAVREGFEVPAHQLLDAPRGIVSFGEDDDGELYVVSLAGSIFRVDLLDS